MVADELYFGFYFEDMSPITDHEEAIMSLGTYRVYGHRSNDRKEVKVGDDRHGQTFSKENWNRLVDLVKDTSPEKDDARALVLGKFMNSSLYLGTYRDNFVVAIKDGRLPKLK